MKAFALFLGGFGGGALCFGAAVIHPGFGIMMIGVLSMILSQLMLLGSE